MKVVICVVALFAVVTGEYCTANTNTATEGCYSMAKNACSPEESKPKVSSPLNCTAAYGCAKNFTRDLQIYANKHITKSFEYLLMSTHFGNYKNEREGFTKLYRKLSDSTWEDAIDVIKYITLRGGKMDFHYDEDAAKKDVDDSLNEVKSLAKSVDIQKDLAEKAFKIYRGAHHSDPEVSDFVQDKFMHKHAETIRELVGYTRDLSRLLRDPHDVGMKLFIFDSYLEKMV